MHRCDANHWHARECAGYACHFHGLAYEVACGGWQRLGEDDVCDVAGDKERGDAVTDAERGAGFVGFAVAGLHRAEVAFCIDDFAGEGECGRVEDRLQTWGWLRRVCVGGDDFESFDFAARKRRAGERDALAGERSRARLSTVLAFFDEQCDARRWGIFDE